MLANLADHSSTSRQIKPPRAYPSHAGMHDTCLVPCVREGPSGCPCILLTVEEQLPPERCRADNPRGILYLSAGICQNWPTCKVSSK